MVFVLVRSIHVKGFGHVQRNIGKLLRLYTAAQAPTTSKDRVITKTDSNGICHVELNRPDKMNAMDLDMFHAIAKIASDLRSDSSVRVVVLSGKGKAFCAGLDVKSVLNNPRKQTQELLKRPSGYGKEGYEIGNLAQDVGYLWRELPVPVICVLQGHVYGAGLQVALGADFRYAAPDCKLSVMESKWGLIPDMSAAITLRELIRIDVAKELTMTGRLVNGLEAAELGLVTRICEDPLESAMSFAKTLTERSPDALAGAKRLFQSTWTASEADCLKTETEIQEKLLASWNQVAASGRSFGWKVPYWRRKSPPP